MKKAYESPVAEKIAFNYRDQVVAASGGSGGSGNDNGNSAFWGVFGTTICGTVDNIVNEWWDGRLCLG